MLTENSLGTVKKRRGTGRPFQKGQTGNPGGRPKKRKELVERCKDLTDKLLDELEYILAHGKDRDKIEVGKIILAYAYGKPETMSKVEVTGKEGGAVIFRWDGE